MMRKEPVKRPKPYMYWMNGYAVTRNWGGPEEGGWWYDSGEPLASFPMFFSKRLFDREGIPMMENWNKVRARIHRKRLAVEKILASENWGNISSMGGGQEVHAQLDPHPAKAWPEHRPRYC